MAEKKQSAKEYEALMLVSPGGYKYELTVTDSGNLDVKFRGKDVNEDADSNA